MRSISAIYRACFFFAGCTPRQSADNPSDAEGCPPPMPLKAFTLIPCSLTRESCLKALAYTCLIAFAWLIDAGSCSRKYEQMYAIIEM